MRRPSAAVTRPQTRRDRLDPAHRGGDAREAEVLGQAQVGPERRAAHPRPPRRHVAPAVDIHGLKEAVAADVDREPVAGAEIAWRVSMASSQPVLMFEPGMTW